MSPLHIILSTFSADVCLYYPIGLEFPGINLMTCHFRFSMLYGWSYLYHTASTVEDVKIIIVSTFISHQKSDPYLPMNKHYAAI